MGMSGELSKATLTEANNKLWDAYEENASLRQKLSEQAELIGELRKQITSVPELAIKSLEEKLSSCEAENLKLRDVLDSIKNMECEYPLKCPNGCRCSAYAAIAEEALTSPLSDLAAVLDGVYMAFGCVVEELERRCPLNADELTSSIIRQGRLELESLRKLRGGK